MSIDDINNSDSLINIEEASENINEEELETPIKIKKNRRKSSMNNSEFTKHTINLTRENEELINTVKRSLGISGERSSAVSIVINMTLKKLSKDILNMFGEVDLAPRLEDNSLENRTINLNDKPLATTNRLPPINF